MKKNNKLSAYLRLMRFDRPIGILLLLWPTLWALWLAAHGLPSWRVLCVFVAGVVLMRAAGCVINDIADRRFDAHVARTRTRPLVRQEVSVKEAVILFVGLCLAAFVLVLLLNPLTILLAFFAALLACMYPFAKRFIAIPQVVLGVAFAFGVPMAFAAVTNHVPGVAWLLFAATFFWILAYDTQYAMADREDDIKIGVKSSAIYFGRFDRGWVVIFQALTLLLLLVVGWWYSLANFYYLMLLVAVGFFIYQYRLLIDRKPDRCFRAFLNNSNVGAVIFFGIFISILFSI